MSLQQSFPLTTTLLDVIRKYLGSINDNPNTSRLNFIHAADHNELPTHGEAYSHYSYLSPQWYAPQTNPDVFVQLHSRTNDWLKILRSHNEQHANLKAVLENAESVLNDLHDKLFQFTPYIYAHMPLLLPLQDEQEQGHGLAFYYAILTWHKEDVQLRTQAGTPHYCSSHHNLSAEHLQMIDEGIDYVHNTLLNGVPKVHKFHIIAKVNLGLLPNEHITSSAGTASNNASIQWFDTNTPLDTDVVQHLENVLHTRDGDTYLNSTQFILPREMVFSTLANGVTNLLALPSIDVLNDLQAKLKTNHEHHQQLCDSIQGLPFDNINHDLPNTIQNHLLGCGYSTEQLYKKSPNNVFSDYASCKMARLNQTEELVFKKDKAHQYAVEVLPHRNFTHDFNWVKVQSTKRRSLMEDINDLETDLLNQEAQAIIANNMNLHQFKSGFDAVRKAITDGKINNDVITITSCYTGSALWLSGDNKAHTSPAFEVCCHPNYDTLQKCHTLHQTIVKPLRVLLKHMFVDPQTNMVSGFDFMAILAIIKAITMTNINKYQKMLDILDMDKSTNQHIINGMSLKDVYTHRMNKLQTMEKCFPDPTIVPYWIELSDVKQYRIELSNKDDIFDMNVFDVNNKKRKLNNGMDLYGKPTPIYHYVYADHIDG